MNSRKPSTNNIERVKSTSKKINEQGGRLNFYHTEQRTLNKRIKRKVKQDDDNVIVERESVSPSDLNRKRFESQISFVAFK